MHINDIIETLKLAYPQHYWEMFDDFPELRYNLFLTGDEGIVKDFEEFRKKYYIYGISTEDLEILRLNSNDWFHNQDKIKDRLITLCKVFGVECMSIVVDYLHNRNARFGGRIQGLKYLKETFPEYHLKECKIIVDTIQFTEIKDLKTLVRKHKLDNIKSRIK